MLGSEMYFGGRVNEPCGGLDVGCKGGERRLRGGSHFLSPSTGLSNSSATHRDGRDQRRNRYTKKLMISSCRKYCSERKELGVLRMEFEGSMTVSLRKDYLKQDLREEARRTECAKALGQPDWHSFQVAFEYFLSTHVVRKHDRKTET